MAEPTQFMYSHKELLELLIKDQNLHEGIWILSLEMQFAALNTGPSDDQLLPAGLVAVSKIGIQKGDTLTALSIDASVVNPA